MSFLLGVGVGVGLMLVPKVYKWVVAKVAAAKTKI